MERGRMLSRMISLATEAHRDQFDKAGRPYILHPIAVMGLLEYDVDNEIVQTVAIGHDLIEDTHVTARLLRELEFPVQVIAPIIALTKVKGQSYAEYQETVKGNRVATIVKMADLRHNSDLRRLKGVTEKDIERTVRYMRFYDELKKIMEV